MQSSKAPRASAAGAWERIDTSLWVGQAYLRRGNSDWYVIRRTVEGKYKKRRIGEYRKALAVAQEVQQLAKRSHRAVTIGDVLTAWLEWRKGGRRPKRIQTTEGNIRLWVRPFFGDLAPTDLTDPLIWRFIRYVIEERKKSPALARNCLSHLRAALNALAHQEILPKWRAPEGWISPTRKLSRACKELLQDYRNRIGRRGAYSAEELGVILEAARQVNWPMYPIVLLAISTGMRMAEIHSLRWSQINLVHGFLQLELTKSGEARYVFLTRRCVEVLREMQASSVGEPVMQRADGRSIGNDWVRWRWRKILRLAMPRGVPRRTFHELRHSFVSAAVQQGVPQQLLQEHVGHHSEAMLRNYTHLDPSNRPDLSWLDAIDAAAESAEVAGFDPARDRLQ